MKPTLYNTDFEAMLKQAHFAAKQAVEAMGPEDLNAFDCGFAWVTLDGKHPLAAYCRNRKANPVELPAFVAMMSETAQKLWLRENRQDEFARRRYYGDKAYPRGWQWWNPGEFPGQAIGHKEAGAKAFRDVLAKHGITVTVGSRYD